MDIGAHLPQLGRGASRSALIEFCAQAERLGVHSAWVSDHIAWPKEIVSNYPYTDDGSFLAPNDMAWLDPIGTLLFAAACTETMLLGQTVLIMGYRPPIQTAKLIATLDHLSEGRAILGAGVGWMKEEFDVLGMPYDNRGARADEQLEIFRLLFSEASVSFDGRYYEFPEIAFEPKPVNSKVPVWIGGSSDAAYRRVVRFGDCFHAAFESMEQVAQSWARVIQFAEESGRDPTELMLSVRVYLDPTGAMAAPVSIQGSADQMADTIGQWADIGADHILVDVTAPGGAAGRLAALAAFMTDVVNA